MRLQQKTVELSRVSPFSLAGETALITGGGTGIGLGIASAFVAAGARVAITGRRSSVLRQASETLGSPASWFVHDLRQPAMTDGLLQEVQSRLGPLTILVNNAGIHLKKRAVETADEEFQEVMGTHVNGAFSLTRSVLRQMERRKQGTILFIASMASILGIPNVAAYSAAKAAHVGLTRALAAEYGPGGIRVNAIAPGWIETPMLENALNGDDRRRNRILARTPMARFGQASDIGMAAVFLCSNAARFVNGVVLPVDGGASIGF